MGRMNNATLRWIKHGNNEGWGLQFLGAGYGRNGRNGRDAPTPVSYRVVSIGDGQG